MGFYDLIRAAAGWIEASFLPKVGPPTLINTVYCDAIGGSVETIYCGVEPGDIETVSFGIETVEVFPT